MQPHLDGDSSIERWSVDTNDPNKVPTVEGENLSEPEIKRHVADAGFKVLGEVAPETPVAEAEQKSFWQTYKPLLRSCGGSAANGPAVTQDWLRLVTLMILPLCDASNCITKSMTWMSGLTPVTTRKRSTMLARSFPNSVILR